MVDKALIAKLREKYMQCPPEGMSADEIREMDDEDLLDFLLNKKKTLALYVVRVCQVTRMILNRSYFLMWNAANPG